MHTMYTRHSIQSTFHKPNALASAFLLAIHSCKSTCTNTEIPKLIDPVALGYFVVALGSIIVGISIEQRYIGLRIGV
jgi:hypothetical protein